MRRALGLLAVLAPLTTLGADANAPRLPESLELHYKVSYGGAPIGTNTRTLKRNEAGEYHYRTHTKPGGMARMFTSVEWFEEGRFDIHQGAVRPLYYLKYREGSRKPHRHSASFQWSEKKLVYANGRSEPLEPGIQDQASMVFAIMLHPPTQTGIKRVQITNGKRIQNHDYQLLRREKIDTVLGELDTIVVQWSTAVGTDDSERLTAWLATEKRYIPVRIITEENGKTVTMRLDSVKGI